MSLFSGKCDFCDHLNINCDNEDEINDLLALSDIYIYGEDHREYKLDVETIKDAVKYYPYLVVLGSFSKEHHTLVLSSTSFIDLEEKERLKYDLKEVKKYWRKCKKHNIEFNENECYKKVSWSNTLDNSLKEIISRVAKDGNNATLDNIHKPLWERFRKNWYEEMLKYGYSEIEAFRWCFNVLWPTKEIVIKRLGNNIL